MRILLIALVLLASAAAQTGPMPGYGDPYSYAADYATEQASEATADPISYVGEHSTQQAVADEAEHAAYMACWTADHNGVEHEVCDPYYIPAGEVGPQNQPEPEPVPEPVENGTDEAQKAAEEYVDNVTAAAEDLVADPTNATGFLDQVLVATQEFADKIVKAVSGIGQFAVATVLAVVGGAVMLVGGLGLGLGLLGTASMTGGSAALMAIGTTTIDGVEAMIGGAKASGSFIGSAIGGVFGALGAGLAAIGAGIATAVSAIGTGLASAAGAVGDAAQSVGSAIADAATSITETVGGWFGGSETSLPGSSDLTDAVPVDDGGLVDGVLDLVE